MQKVLVLLNGCGHQDGSEIHETVFTLLALEEAGFIAECVALDEWQNQVLNHISGEKLPEKRNMLIEAARMSRGKIKPITKADQHGAVGLIIPGGSGTARNLCDFAEKRQEMVVHPEVRSLIENMHHQKKPIGAICISPIIVARVLSHYAVYLTIGNDKKIATIIQEWGAQHQECGPSEVCVDAKNKIVSTPAYMYGNSSMSDVLLGIRNLVHAFKKSMS